MAAPVCILCGSRDLTPVSFHGAPRDYLDCRICRLRFLEPSLRLDPEEEKSRYLAHNNDIHDVRYQRFVDPLVTIVQAYARPGATGLDFGAGTGPVLTKMLENHGFTVSLFDPYFWPDPMAFSRKYDFVVACEVVEHLFRPGDEFERIREALSPGGFFALMTSFLNTRIDFETWYYRRDPTHVSFYSRETFDWIQKHIGFASVETIDERIAVLRL